MQHDKWAQLLMLLRQKQKVAIALSGGVDSALLLVAACQALGAQHVLAITAQTEALPTQDLQYAQQLCADLSVAHVCLPVALLQLDAFQQNTPDRCYHCKKHLLEKMLHRAALDNLILLEGSNLDDTADYRPGMRAVQELAVCSPLLEVGLHKEEIRALCRQFGLPAWEKPASACLASRVAYGEAITAETLQRIAQAEQYLQSLGLAQVRVRVHGLLARIETNPESFSLLLSHASEIFVALQKIGFSYVTLDLQGYRTGSLNESLSRSQSGLE